jgi:GntR family transcriptional repressor for pyruvate dehydrogenase complex
MRPAQPPVASHDKVWYGNDYSNNESTQILSNAPKSPDTGGSVGGPVAPNSRVVRPPAPRPRGRNNRRILKTSELIAREIILDISEGGLTAGDSLPSEASMIQHYEVGRASLREALRLLEVQGLIKIRAGAKGGPVVGAATAESLAQMLTLFFGLAGCTYEDLTDVMLITQPTIAEVAARQKLSRAEIDMLNASVDQACGVPSPQKLQTHQNFHRLLVAFGHNTVWTLLADSVALIFVGHVMAATDSRGFHEATLEDHREIADAVIAGNPEAAGAAMYRHTVRMIDYYRSHIPAIFSQLIEWR